ncbi:MAG: hypothetical protein ACRD2A_18400 [Vicinamibacterales bacterium]
MKTTLAIAVGLALALPGPAAAHRLDEYFQASRLSLTRDGVAVEIDLTAGSSLAARVSALLDTDASGNISLDEAVAYARCVLAEVLLEVDGVTVPVGLTSVEAPTLDEIAAGVGTFRVTAVGARRLGHGRVLVRYRNNH